MLESLKNSLNRAARKMGASQGILQCRIQQVWADVVGELLARQSRPTGLKAGTLFVTTTGPAWTQELMFRQYEIIKRFNRELPQARVRDMRFRVGSLEIPDLPEQVRAEAGTDWDSIPVDPERSRTLDDLASQVQDPELAESLRRLMKQLERKRVVARRRGHRPCVLCSQMQRSSVCGACRREQQQNRWTRILKALGRSPWLTCEGLRETFLDLSSREYFRARQRLWAVWEKTLGDGLRERFEGAPWPSSLRAVAMELCMLATSVPGDQIEERHVWYALGKKNGQAYLENRVPASRRWK